MSEPIAPRPGTDAVRELVIRSRRLGSDPRNTNFGGGNTSAKVSSVDPLTSLPIDLLYVKGSGGDLATLTEDGLAVLRLDRVQSLVDIYAGVGSEDDMVAAFDFCLHGRSSAVPSIDTAMHGLLDAKHVDHLHPDSGVAFATSLDGLTLTRRCFGDRVGWLPWRRPGFQLGLEIAAFKRANPDAIGVVLGGHGITAWADTAEECEARSLLIIRTAEEYIAEHGRAEPFGDLIPGFGPLSQQDRQRRAAELFPALRGIASTDNRQVGHFSDDPRVLDFLSRSKHADIASRGVACPDHLLRTKARPLVIDLHGSAPLATLVARITSLHNRYREEYRSYYDRYADADSPVIRGSDPVIVLVPGLGMFSFGATKQSARIAGELYINAINAMRGAESLSRYAPIPDDERFRVEYWSLEEAKLTRMPKPRALSSRVAFVTGAGSGIGKAIAMRLATEGACVVVADIDGARAEAVARDIGGRDSAIAVTVDVTDEKQVAEAFAEAVRAFGGVDITVNNAGLSISKPLVDTTTDDWDAQHGVMARGSFLVSREAARIMIPQGIGGDLIYIVSKNAVFAGPNNIAYAAAKADEAHQVRLLATELGAHGIRVNGVNPDGVVRGSGIFEGGWGASRAATYGIPEEQLGEFYAQRTVLKKEVLPENVAAAVFALIGGELSLTTGLHIPVDAGITAAFLR